jgi:hypothetical protein
MAQRITPRPTKTTSSSRRLPQKSPIQAVMEVVWEIPRHCRGKVLGPRAARLCLLRRCPASISKVMISSAGLLVVRALGSIAISATAGGTMVKAAGDSGSPSRVMKLHSSFGGFADNQIAPFAFGRLPEPAVIGEDLHQLERSLFVADAVGPIGVDYSRSNVRRAPAV